MKRQLKWFLLPLLTIQQISFANSLWCKEPAPLLNSSSYFDTDDQFPLANQQLHLLRQFADTVTGRWYGKETVAQCKGHHQHPTEVKQHYIVSAEVSTSKHGELRLVAEKDLIDRSIAKLQTLWLTPATENTDRHSRWQTLEFINPTTFIYSHKYRARNGLPTTQRHSTESKATSRLIHEINKLSINDDVLTIDRKLYVNGVIAERSGVWLRKAT